MQGFLKFVFFFSFMKKAFDVYAKKAYDKGMFETQKSEKE